MKIAVTSQGKEAGSKVDPRFGRCKCFMLFDEERETYTELSNEQNLQSAQGAGVQAAQHLLDQDVKAVITGNVGPKAFRVLSANGVKIYTASDLTVAEAVDAYRQGRLAEVAGETVEGHWI